MTENNAVDEGTTQQRRPNISNEDKLKLWVRSGGRCNICNKYLLGDEYFVFEIPLGEMAHMVGWKNSDRSPRGISDLSASERNKADNLMLLCPTHHQVIDNSGSIEEFSVDRLIAVKREHEERIEYVTGLGPDQATAVIRMFGTVRGAAVEVSREHACKIVQVSAERYARFPFAHHRDGIEIDLTGLPEPEESGDAYWDVGISAINQKMTIIEDAVRSGEVRHFSVFALARGPLLVYLGYRLDDKVPTELYQKHRSDGESWAWSDAESESFEILTLQEGADITHVALLLSLSGTISIADLPEEIDESFSIFEVRPVGVTPHRNIIRSKASLTGFEQTYHELLSRLERTHKAAREIHLFAAVPVTAAITCGRGIMRDAHPALKVYDRTTDGYRLALTVNGK